VRRWSSPQERAIRRIVDFLIAEPFAIRSLTLSKKESDGEWDMILAIIQSWRFGYTQGQAP
jgi:hypothetical protein